MSKKKNFPKSDKNVLNRIIGPVEFQEDQLFCHLVASCHSRARLNTEISGFLGFVNFKKFKNNRASRYLYFPYFALQSLPVTLNRKNDPKMSLLGSIAPRKNVISCLKAIFNFRNFVLQRHLVTFHRQKDLGNEILGVGFLKIYNKLLKS